MLFFRHGALLSDPNELLRGDGKIVRSIILKNASDLDDPRVRRLIGEALNNADVPFDPAVADRLVIKSISAKRRPRQPRPSAQ